MRQQAVRYIVLSQLVFVCTIIICALIEPRIVFDNIALSVYGSLPDTILPFAAGMLMVAAILLRAANALPKSNQTNQTLARLFLVLAILLVGLVMTPININDFFYVSHIIVAISLFTVELAASAWLLIKTRQGLAQAWPGYILYGLQITGFLVTGLSSSEVGWFQLQATGQIIATFSFAAILIRTVAQIEHVKLNLDTSLKTTEKVPVKLD